ncbi:MAG: histidine kinase [Chloroflexi bacterium]|nr:histidine kinase [Chloroflexota bacterium]
MCRGGGGRYAPCLVSTTVTAPRLFAARPRSGLLLDVAIAVAAFGGTLALLRHGGIGPARPGSGELDLVGIALAACSTMPLIASRRFPLAVFVATGVASVALAGLGYRIDLLLGPAVALYLVAASREPEVAWTWRSAATVAGLLGAYLVATATAQRALPDTELLHTGLAWAVAWFAGERSRLRREQIADLNARAHRVEREAEQERLLAVSEERARIARDLHDSAGHAINVIAVRAGAARLRHHEEPDRSLVALQAIEEVARETAGEIDQIVGTLRERGSANGVIEAPSGLASLDTLITRHREAGIEVAFGESGTPRTLGAAADQAAYRILQEALTNAARHGTGSARVHIAFDDDSVGLTVNNPMRAPQPAPSSGGHGLIGMRERATLLGGTLEANGADGQFRVRARIPYGGPQG